MRLMITLLTALPLLGGACHLDEPHPREAGDQWRDDTQDAAGETGPEPKPKDELDYLLEVADQWPPTERYDFIGYVQIEGSGYWIHGEDPAPSVPAALIAAGVDPMDPTQGLAGGALEPDKHDVGRGLLLSADGRLFLETLDSFKSRVQEVADGPTAGMFYSDEFDDSLKEEGQRFRDGIHGGDSRKLVGAPRDYPMRAVGVQMMRHTGEAGGEWDDTTWARRGSATMVGPRAAATAAHVIMKDKGGTTARVMGVAPGAKGISFNGEGDPGVGQGNGKFEFGIRRVSWYAWPLGFYSSGDYKYDYAMVTLTDISWSPGWIRFGHQSVGWLDYRRYNMFGYPDKELHCDASPEPSETCHGHMYRVYGQVREVYPYSAKHWLDTESGQSGSGIYYLSKSNHDRVLYLINVAECSGVSDCGLAKRLRSGSFNTLCFFRNQWPSTYFSNSSNSSC